MTLRTPVLESAGYAGNPTNGTLPVSDEPERRRSPQHANLRVLFMVLIVAGVAAIVVFGVMLATVS